ncbi:GGDEF domain-containing protein [Aurantiacibacter poecillastricola]|uniref:GGDEF domain-containing protein n=1 Tax=Aurantiacibacter poecillastricola TaxID=3064385 RepID=UPI00273FCFC3|nr:GGDEF domain-containing protein [Aurantiacibacter sp. 219JJ12-13]MDP5261708.1 GGDEF domain-containing protein [Aurantiacibacter sp. 219JJ12-13]
MIESEIRLTLRSRALQWLTDPGRSVPEAIRQQLLLQLLASPGAIAMGAIVGLVVSVASIARDGSAIFVILLLLEGLIACARFATLAHLRAQAKAGISADIGIAIVLSCLWCALQGMTAFFAMRTQDPVLMVLTATMVMALIGPLCARNYAAPRLALLLVCLCDFPFAIGALATGNPWFLIIAAMTPLFLFGALQIVTNYKSAMVRALSAEHENLRRSRRDPLTDLLNRGGLDAQMEKLASTQPLAVIAMDLDGFKEINDRYGHAAGDAVLKEVARRMSAVVPAPDILARLGGDEFMAVLPGSPPDMVEQRAKALLHAIRDNSYAISGASPVHIGMSLGYACLPEDTTSVDRLREYADAALYHAKGAGKGKTARYEGKLAA